MIVLYRVSPYFNKTFGFGISLHLVGAQILRYVPYTRDAESYGLKQDKDGWDFNTVARKKTTAPLEQEASAPTPTPKTETAPQPDIEQQLTAGDEEVAPVAVAIAGNPDDDIPF